MANQEQLGLLKQGPLIWNQWITKRRNSNIDLRAANISSIDLSSVDLYLANLSSAYLVSVNFRSAHLGFSNLSYANLEEADLSYANLSGANLSYANLARADLSYANLSGTDLSSADLHDADLTFANFNKANLSGADFSEARLQSTVFASVDLRTVKGLETIIHNGPSTIGTDTLEQSKSDIPEAFLKGAGLRDTSIIYSSSIFNQPIEYYTCFLSYSSKDELFAQRLHNDLQQEGVRCWFAPEDMDIGDKIRHRIDESLKLYDKLLLILSERSIESSWVEYEVERALSRESRGIPNVLYPVRIDQTILTCSKLWAREIMQTRHIGNFENWNDPEQYQDNFQRLLRALNTKKE